MHFSLNKGEHKFILGELDFMDDVGKKVYHATRESALHENYTIFQGENKLAFMKHKIHLGGYSFEVQDGSGVAVGELHCKLHKGRVGEYWYTDQQDNIQAVVSWEGVLKFTLSDPGFSRIYAEASLDLPGGIIGDLKALGNRQSTVFIPYSSALPLSVILSFCVAIANMP